MKNQVTQNQILGLFLSIGHQLWVVMIKFFAGPSSRLIQEPSVASVVVLMDTLIHGK